jgi:predicted nucleotidyltransferase
MKNLDKIHKVSQLSIPILKRNGVISAALFGSFVRSDDSIESDVDFLLEYQDGVSLFDVAELKRELEEKLDRKVDLVSLKYLNKRIREKVIQEKIRIL